MLVALLVMIPARWAISALSPVGSGSTRRPFAYHRARACLALLRLRERVQDWATPKV